jgi:hypothetical protein
MKSEKGRELQDVLVISDAEGNLYLIRRETLEAGRVVDKPRVERILKDPQAAGLTPGTSYKVVKTFQVTTPAPAQTIRDSLRNL